MIMVQQISRGRFKLFTFGKDNIPTAIGFDSLKTNYAEIENYRYKADDFKMFYFDRDVLATGVPRNLCKALFKIDSEIYFSGNYASGQMIKVVEGDLC